MLPFLILSFGLIDSTPDYNANWLRQNSRVEIKNSEFTFKFKGLSGISLKHPKCKEGHYSFKKESKDVYSNYVIVSEIKFFFYDVSRLELEEIKDTENIYEITITGFVDRDISESKLKSLIFQKAGFILAENGVQLNRVLPKFIELPQY